MSKRKVKLIVFSQNTEEMLVNLLEKESRIYQNANIILFLIEEKDFKSTHIYNETINENKTRELPNFEV